MPSPPDPHTVHHACRSIYVQMVEGHLQVGGFAEEVARMGPKLVDATIDLHRQVMQHFLPTSGAV